MKFTPRRACLASLPQAGKRLATIALGPMLLQPLAMCLALLCVGTTFSQQPEATIASAVRLTILSYNIHHAEGVDGRLDVERIAQVIRQSQADVIALQEVDQGVARSQNVDQAQQLAERLGMHFAFGANIELQGGHYGNAILSRYPIKSTKNHMLPNDNGGEQRGVLEADIALPGSVTLKFLSTHFDHRSDPVQRLASAKWINENFAAVDDLPVCLAGDLNAVPDSSVLEELKKQWTLPSGQDQPTIPVDQPVRKIDYVLLSKLSAQHRWATCEVESRVLDEAIASDHRPVLSVLEIQQNATSRNNVLLICIDDLRPELGCYGVDYIHSPNIDRLASRGTLFQRHYVQAPTCGASRNALLTGRYGGRDNNALFQRAAQLAAGKEVPPSMPEWFRQHGYRTVSVGKVSHHPGGRGGADWNDDSIIEMPGAWDAHLCPSGAWQHPRGFMHGLAHGEIRGQTQQMDVFQSIAGDDSIYPDGLTTAEALNQLQSLAANPQQPFFLAVGILRPHLPFGAPAQYMEPYQTASLPAIAHPEKPAGRTTWHASGEFMKYNRWGRNPNQDAEFATQVRKHYAACVSYADAQVGRIVAQLQSVGAAENTVIVLWGDHGWHLGEHAIWGKHSLFEESLHSPLIICPPAAAAVGQTETIVESVDIFPTLCELAGLPQPDFVHGSSLGPLLRGDSLDEQTAVSYFNMGRTLRTDRYRLIVHRDGYRELYDHQQLAGETKNLAAQAPEVCDELEKRLDRQFPDEQPK